MDSPAMDLWKAVTTGTRDEARNKTVLGGSLTLNEEVSRCRCFICVQIDERGE